MRVFFSVLLLSTLLACGQMDLGEQLRECHSDAHFAARTSLLCLSAIDARSPEPAEVLVPCMVGHRDCLRASVEPASFCLNTLRECAVHYDRSAGDLAAAREVCRAQSDDCLREGTNAELCSTLFDRCIAYVEPDVSGGEMCREQRLDHARCLEVTASPRRCEAILLGCEPETCPPDAPPCLCDGLDSDGDTRIDESDEGEACVALDVRISGRTIVQSDDSGVRRSILCPGLCRATYRRGTVVRLIADRLRTTTGARWAGCTSEVGGEPFSCLVEVDRPIAVTVTVTGHPACRDDLDTDHDGIRDSQDIDADGDGVVDEAGDCEPMAARPCEDAPDVDDDRDDVVDEAGECRPQTGDLQCVNTPMVDDDGDSEIDETGECAL